MWYNTAILKYTINELLWSKTPRDNIDNYREIPSLVKQSLKLILQDSLLTYQQNLGTVLMMQGEAGMGKSMLGAKLTSMAEQDGLMVLEGKGRVDLLLREIIYYIGNLGVTNKREYHSGGGGLVLLFLFLLIPNPSHLPLPPVTFGHFLFHKSSNFTYPPRKRRLSRRPYHTLCLEGNSLESHGTCAGP